MTALKGMKDDIFTHHVTPHKNDFSNWLSDCLKEKELAKKVRHTRSTKEMRRTIARHIKDPQPGQPQRPTPWTEIPPGQEGIIRDIELLSQSISEQSFLHTYYEGKFNVSSKITKDEVRESDAGITVLSRAKDENPEKWHDNFTELPIFNTDLPRLESMNFLHRLNLLHDRILNKDKTQSRRLYTELKREYETKEFNPEDKKSIHTTLTRAYHDIIKL